MSVSTGPWRDCSIAEIGRPCELCKKVKIKQGIDNVYAVIALQFLGYKDVDWKLLKGFDQRNTPVSVYLAVKFIAEARDIALNEVQAEELFDQTEMAIPLGYVHHKLLAGAARPTGMPIGRFSWKSYGETLEAELKRIEALPDSDAFFKAGMLGMLGGNKATAAPTLQKVRELQRDITRYW